MTVYVDDVVAWLQGREWLVLNGYLPRYHAVLCDPPYFLGSIVKRFGKPDSAPAQYGTDGAFQRASRGFMGQTWDGFESPWHYQEWVTEWATLLLSFVYPGAVLLAFGGTRTYHRLTAGLEDAGWEIADSLLYWGYGSGFPKSHSISKALDREAGAQREVVGRYQPPGMEKPWNLHRAADERTVEVFASSRNNLDITAPATPLAAQWDGYGTALKPAYEPLILAHKPLTSVPHQDIIIEVNQLIGGALCLLLSFVNDAESLLKLNPAGPNEASISVAMLAALLHGQKSGELSEKMDMFNSPGMVLTCLNIASLWNDILGTLLNHGSTFTTSTATEVITALRTLKSLLSEIIPASIIQDVIRSDGHGCGANSVEVSLTADCPNTNDIQKHFAAALATWKTGKSGTPANTAATALQLIIPSVSSVLRDVITHIGINTENGIQSPIGPFAPDYFSIIMARAPRNGHTYAALAQEFGTGALNIDGSRIEATDSQLAAKFASVKDAPPRMNHIYGADHAPRNTESHPAGRWPANVILDEHAAAALDQQSGELGASRFFKVVKVPSPCVLCNLRIGLESSRIYPHSIGGSIWQSASIADGNTESEEQAADSARGHVPDSGLLGSADKDRNNGGHVSTADNSSKSTSQIGIPTALNNVPMMQSVQNALSVRFAGSLCDSCVTAIVQRVVAMQQGQTLESHPCQDYMPEHNAQILNRNLVQFVESLDDTATTTIIANLSRLFGFVQLAIESIIVERDSKFVPTRFSYHSKAATWERDAGLNAWQPVTVTDGRNTPSDNAYQRGQTLRRNAHPTVKPIRLTEYLARLILPPVLDEPRRLLVPFSGSGSEMIGALLAGWDMVDGIEQSEEYANIARARLAWWSQFETYEQAKRAYKREKSLKKKLSDAEMEQLPLEGEWS